MDTETNRKFEARNPKFETRYFNSLLSNEISKPVLDCHSELVSGSHKSLILLDVPPAAGFSMHDKMEASFCNVFIEGLDLI